MEKSKIDLIKNAQKGDEQSFQILYDEYYYIAYHYAIRLCSCDADAKDVTQETFICIYKNIKNLREPIFFKTWLLRILGNEVNRFYNKQKRLFFFDNDTLASLVVEYDQVNKYDIAITDVEILIQFIRKLPEKQGSMLELVYLQQYTTKEVAQMLSLSEGTVKSRVFLAKRTLYKLVKEFELQEGRSLTLYTDMITPTSIVGVFLSLKAFIAEQEVWGMTSIIASASLVTLTSTAILQSQTESKYEDMKLPVESKIQSIDQLLFEPVFYQGKMIISVKSAYFTIKKWGIDVEAVKKKTSQEKEEIKEVYEAFVKSKSPYLSAFIENGWIDAFEEY